MNEKRQKVQKMQIQETLKLLKKKSRKPSVKKPSVMSQLSIQIIRYDLGIPPFEAIETCHYSLYVVVLQKHLKHRQKIKN